MVSIQGTAFCEITKAEVSWVDHNSRISLYPYVFVIVTRNNPPGYPVVESPREARNPWWRHQMETFSASLALCEGNPPDTGWFPSQRSLTRRFGVFFDLRLNKRLIKLWIRRLFKTLWRPLWRHCNASFSSSASSQHRIRENATNPIVVTVLCQFSCFCVSISSKVTLTLDIYYQLEINIFVSFTDSLLRNICFLTSWP